MNKLTCPNCDHDMRGEPIPLDDQGLYGNMEYYPLWIPYYNEDLGAVDSYSCPFCGYTEYVRFN